VEKITFTAGSVGIPVHVNVASRHRMIPRAGFAAVQDDIRQWVPSGFAAGDQTLVTLLNFP